MSIQSLHQPIQILVLRRKIGAPIFTNIVIRTAIEYTKYLRNTQLNKKKEKESKEILLNFYMYRLEIVRNPISQSINEKLIVHDEALNQHFLRILFRVRVDEAILVF